MQGLHKSRTVAVSVAAKIHQAADVLLLSTTAAFTWEGGTCKDEQVEGLQAKEHFRGLSSWCFRIVLKDSQ